MAPGALIRPDSVSQLGQFRDGVTAVIPAWLAASAVPFGRLSLGDKNPHGGFLRGDNSNQVPDSIEG
jgi:hypothetical protein